MKNQEEERTAPVLLCFPTEQLGQGPWMTSSCLVPSVDSSDLATIYSELPSSPRSPDGLTPEKLANQSADHKFPWPWTMFRSPQSCGAGGATKGDQHRQELEPVAATTAVMLPRHVAAFH